MPSAGRDLSIPADVAADIADAEAAVRALHDAGAAHVSFEGLARFLLRAESVGSSKIEGLETAARRLARAEAAVALGGKANDRVAVEVLGNITAMESAVELATSADLLMRVLPGAPIVTVQSACKLIGRSAARTADAVNALAASGVLRQRNIGRQRYRVFEATEVLDLFTGLERTLASPTGYTMSGRPVRLVPQRPEQASVRVRSGRQ